MDQNLNPEIFEAVIVNQGDVFALEDCNNPNPNGNEVIFSASNFAKQIQIVEDLGIVTAKSFAKLHPGVPGGTLSADRKVSCTPISARNILNVCAFEYTPGQVAKVNVGALATVGAGTDILTPLLSNTTYRLRIKVSTGNTIVFPNGTQIYGDGIYRSGLAVPTDLQVYTGLAASINANPTLNPWITAAVITAFGKNYLQITSKNVGPNYEIDVIMADGFGLPSQTLNLGDTYYGLNQPGLDTIGGLDYMNQLFTQITGYSKFVGMPGEPTQFIAPEKWKPNKKYGVIWIQHYKDSGDGMHYIQRLINLYIAFELSTAASDPYSAADDYVWGNITNDNGTTPAAGQYTIRDTGVGGNVGTSLREWLDAVNPAWIPQTASKVFGV
jgi:hypothetical protein